MTPEERATEEILLRLCPGDSEAMLKWRDYVRPEIHNHIAAAVEEAKREERDRIVKAVVHLIKVELVYIQAEIEQYTKELQ